MFAMLHPLLFSEIEEVHILHVRTLGSRVRMRLFFRDQAQNAHAAVVQDVAARVSSGKLPFLFGGNRYRPDHPLEFREKIVRLSYAEDVSFFQKNDFVCRGFEIGHDVRRQQNDLLP